MTWRLHGEEMPESVLSRMARGEAVVLAHFHEDEWALLGFSANKNNNVLVSMSDDGTIMASFLEKLGFYVARGSSSRRAAAGLLQLIDSVKTRDKKLVSLAIDGPRGPRRQAKAGVAFLAEHLNAPIFFVSAVATPVKIFRRSWSRAFVPLPFAKMYLKYTGPIEFSEVESLLDDRKKLLARVEEGLLTAKRLAEKKMKESLSSR